MLFKKFDLSNHKLNNIWIDKGSEFYKRSIISWLQEYDIEMYSTHNEGKSENIKKSISISNIIKYQINIKKYVC